MILYLHSRPGWPQITTAIPADTQRLDRLRAHGRSGHACRTNLPGLPRDTLIERPHAEI